MNPQKQKGDRWERALAAWLRGQGWPHAERTRAGWEDDRGDIAGTPGVTWSAKDCRTLRWSEWLSDLADQVVNAGTDIGVLALKRPGTADAGQALAVMRLDKLVELLHAAGYGDGGPQ